MTDIATNLLEKRVTVRKYIKGHQPLDGSWENYTGIVRGVSTAKHDEFGVSFHLLIETVSSDRKGNRSGPSRLFVADVSSDEVHVVPNECGATDNVGSVCNLEPGHPMPHASWIPGGHQTTWTRDCRVTGCTETDVVEGSEGAFTKLVHCLLERGHLGPHVNNRAGHQWDWTCPAASRECLIRQRCTNKCGKNDPKP